MKLLSHWNMESGVAYASVPEQWSLIFGFRINYLHESESCVFVSTHA